MKGVGAEHQMLMSATSICECEHSHLYVSLTYQRTALPCYTFQKEKKTPIFGVRKGKARIGHLGPIDFYKKTKL